MYPVYFVFPLLEVAISVYRCRINRSSIGIPPSNSIESQLLPSVSKSFDERIVVFCDNDRSLQFCFDPRLFKMARKWDLLCCLFLVTNGRLESYLTTVVKSDERCCCVLFLMLQSFDNGRGAATGMLLDTTSMVL